MKTLQSNFTTPEQSKRLLELGVPADSADCYYDIDEVNIDGNAQIYVLPPSYTYNYDSRFYLPCWSVGRLMEIYEICTGFKYQRENIRKKQLVQEAINKIEVMLKCTNMWEFSKLEG